MGQKYIGERFGDYKLVRLLGEGGFASVYLGEEVHNGTFGAVKLLKEQKVHDFINEVSRTNRLQHPNIVKVLDFGIRTPDDTAFIIMEYAPNGSFRDKYPRNTRVPLDMVVTTVKQVASALQYAHDQRVIHRDVKPENLLLNARNMVLLSDFGIATASRTAMTAYAGQGDIIGTYAYMAPEQLIGRPVSASDQYSLAIMVYEWLCGTLPFEAREYIQWHYLHEKVPPPALREHIPSLVPAVEQVVLKALAKKPEERFERVKTFASALERAARREDVSPAMSTPGPTIHSTQVDSTLAGKQDNVLAQTPANPTEQLFQEGVRAQANAKIEEAFRIWQQIINTPGVAERYSTPARKRVQELRIEMISLRRKQAQEANMQGRWQDEIRLWEDLLALEPSSQDLAPLLKSPLTLGEATSNIKKSIQERLRIAHQNEQFAWMYTGAQQFIHNKDNASARTQLQMLWQDVPYYGDPSDLAQMLGLPAPLNYEQTIVAEQALLEQEKLAQERQEQEWQEQGRLARERQEQERQEQERLAQERQGQERQEQERLARKNLIVVIMLVIGGIVGSIIVGKIGEAKGGTIGAAIGGTVGAAIGAAIGRIIGGRGAIGILEALIGGIVGAIVGVGIAIIGVGVGLGGLTVLIGIGGVIGGVIGGGAGGFLGGVVQTVEEGESTGGGISGGIVGGIVGGVVGGLVGGVVGGLAGGGLVGSLVGGVVGGLAGGGTGGGLMGGALRVEKATKKH